MANEYYLVKIGSIWLTDDGTGIGRACLNKVEGLSQLFLAHVGSTAVPISGLPFNFILPNEGGGVDLITQPFAVKTSVLASLKSMIDTANTNGTAIQVQISDGPGAQNMDCDPLFRDGKPPLDFGANFYNADMYDVSIRLITRGYS